MFSHHPLPPPFPSHHPRYSWNRCQYPEYATDWPTVARLNIPEASTTTATSTTTWSPSLEFRIILHTSYVEKASYYRRFEKHSRATQPWLFRFGKPRHQTTSRRVRSACRPTLPSQPPPSSAPTQSTPGR